MIRADAMGWRLALPTAAAAAVAITYVLPVFAVDLPVPTPSLPAILPSATPLPVPTPSLLAGVPTPGLGTPTPSPPVQLSPSPTAATPTSPSPVAGVSPRPSGLGSGRPATTGTHPVGTGSGGGAAGAGIAIPFTPLVLTSPLSVALVASLAALPLLGGIWILLFGRTWIEARRRRDATIRLALASDLGLSPHELTSLSTPALFKLREQAAFDELTGVLRRAAGIAAVDREIARARRQKEPLSVAFIDLVALKAINHRGGRPAGDQLLRDLTEIVRDGLRGQDLVFRYGGDEFVCLLPDTPEDDGRSKLDQIHQLAAARGIDFCFGIAELRASDDVVSLLGRADGDLYDRKAHRELASRLELLPV